MSETRLAGALSLLKTTECPFLYQTKTIFHQTRRHQTRSVSTTREWKPLLNPRDGGGSDQPTSFLKQKAAAVSSRKPKPELGPSITAAEKAAFEKVWKLFESPSPSTRKAHATSTNHTDANYKNIVELFSPPPHPQGVDNDIPSQVATGPDIDVQPGTQQDSKTDSSISNVFAAPRASKPRWNLSRESAMKEIRGFLKETSDPSSTSTQSTATIQSTTLRIVEDTADSLTAALSSTTTRPDLAMWQVAEEKIFALIKLLRPTKQKLSSPSPSEANDSGSSTPQPQLHPLIPSSLPLVHVLSQAYPSLTLLILRHYAIHYPASPYALALLPTIRSLGPTSYVLGAHTHFYNTLLSLYWRIYSDLRGMNTLLAEMESNGMHFDLGTWEALKAIGEDRQLDMDGVGQRGAAWWGRTEQLVWWEKVGVEWRDTIRRKLEAQGLLPGEVMREDGSGEQQDEMAEKEENPEYVAIL